MKWSKSDEPLANQCHRAGYLLVWPPDEWHLASRDLASMTRESCSLKSMKLLCPLLIALAMQTGTSPGASFIDVTKY